MAMLRIRRAQALDGFRLHLELFDGSMVERDIAGLLTGPVLGQLVQDPALFARVKVEAGAVAWPNGVDLCPDVLIWGGLPPTQAVAPPPFLALPLRAENDVAV